MTRVAWLDCASGASGDMLLGALVDLGLPLEALRGELAKLPLGGYRLTARKVQRSGLQATKVDVEVEHGGGHDHGHEHDHGHGHEHRGLREILSLLERSTLEEAVTSRAALLFRRLAEAEAAVHGTSVEEVHFHEVGAVDSIVDVVGAVIGLRWLRAERIVASPLNVGTGTVKMSHGLFPVPPPATARLVTGVPVYGEGDGELLTPTGALLVTGHASAYGPLPRMRPEGVGHGAGSKETPGRPNVLRIIVGAETETETGAEMVLVLETAIDDMSPQLFGPLVEKLLAAGALDAYCTAIQMKKNRPGVLLTLIAPAGARAALEDVLFAESTTLGVRWQEWRRTTLEREVVRVDTAFGAVGVKVARRHGRVTNVQPEFEDCVRAAEAHGRPVKEVWAAAVAAAHARTP